MNKQICIIILLLTCRICNAQNLVPNPSFEDTVACPTMMGQVTNAKFWHDLKETPDYFNSCSSINMLSVPYNYGGFQYPHSGDAYMGLFTYTSSGGFYREIIGADLITPLVVGQKYYVNFKVCAGFNPWIGNINAATDKLGMLFSTVDYISSPPPINNFSQIFTDSIISDTINWSTIKGSFIADSAYTFISIGNFFDDAHTDTLHFNNFSAFRAYYCIDDVCVSNDSLYSEVWTSLPKVVIKEQIKIFPNPINNELNVTVRNNEQSEIILCDITSRKLLQQQFINSVSLNTQQLAKGIYLYEVRNKNGVIKKGKVVKD